MAVLSFLVLPATGRRVFFVPAMLSFFPRGLSGLLGRRRRVSGCTHNTMYSIPLAHIRVKTNTHRNGGIPEDTAVQVVCESFPTPEPQPHPQP